MENNKTRVALWDNIRFLLIICVSIGHFVNEGSAETYLGIYMFMYSFHMPLFMFVSGLFHKNNNIIRKFLAYVSIYMVYELAIFAVKRGFGKKVKFNPLRETSAPWFMLVLAFFVVIGYILRNCNKVIVLAVSVALSLIAGYITQINDFLCLSRVFYFFPFYYLGICMNRQQLEKFACNKKLKIAGAGILLAWLAVCMLMTGKVLAFRPFVTGKAGYPEIKYAIGPVWRMMTYCMGMVISAAFVLAAPTSDLKMFTKFGQRTIQVYFWHRIILYVLTYVGVADFFYNNNLLKIVWIGMAVLVAIITSFKIFEFPTATIIKISRLKRKK